MILLKSMTDFIGTDINVESLSVYNEDCSWAEKYSEYYSEDISNQIGDITNSSEYKFFGESYFIQESVKKGLLAGGVLALVSGAFFMILKLLKGGGSNGGSSSSTSKKGMKSEAQKSSKETKKQMHESNRQMNSLRDEMVDFDTKRSELNKQSEEIKANANKPLTPEETAQVFNVPNNNPTPTENKPKEEKKEPEKPKLSTNETPKNNENKQTGEKQKYEELEAEEKLVFNAKIIIDKIKTKL